MMGAAIGRGLAGLLYGVSSYDLLTVGVVAVVVHAALTASVVLARKAGRFDPMIALRQSDFQETSARVTGLHPQFVCADSGISRRGAPGGDGTAWRSVRTPEFVRKARFCWAKP